MAYKVLIFATLLAVGYSTRTTATVDNNELGLSTFPHIEKATRTYNIAPQNLPTEFTTSPEGETVKYASQGLVNSPYGLIFQAGYKDDLTFSSDDETVYIPQLIPNAGKPGTYLKGILGVNDAGKRTLTVKANQLINRYDTFDDYMLAKVGQSAQEYAATHNTTVEALETAAGWQGPMHFYFVPAKADNSGEKAVLLDEYVLTENADGEFLPDSSYDKLYLFSWYYGGPEGYINAAANVSLHKIINETCEVPTEGVEWKEFIHQWDAAVFGPTFDKLWEVCRVGFKGDKVYIPGLIPDIHEAYAEGTIDSNGIITINENPLFTHDNSVFYHYIIPVDSSATFDLEWNLTYLEAFPNFQLKYDNQNGTLIPLNDMKVVDCYCYGQSLDIYSHKYKINGQDKSISPAEVYNLGFSDDGAFQWFSFETSGFDKEGWVMNPDNVTYQCFLNHDMETPYVFTNEKYINLKADTTEIPLLYTDPDYDFVYDNGLVQVYWYEPEWKSFGVRLCYNVDGNKNYSDVVWVNNPNAGIDDLSIDDSCGVTYDLLGRKVTSDYKGIVIRNNKKYIQK